mmetsp:Transcript_97626/g.252634  ORF Transcript_97626/g.252634 Transcript_97626/m.252634 type:complete len:211 (+) Transcript_97626:56-688(+)
MPGVLGAVGAQRRRNEKHLKLEQAGLSRAGTERLHVNAAEKRKAKAVKSVMGKYDTNNSGKLEEEQIKKLLADLDSSTPEGTPCSDEEFEFIMKISDHEGDNCLDPEELVIAIRAWHTYTTKRKDMEDLIDKYDENKTGSLSREEMQKYLKDLNGSIEPTEEEVNWVMEEADVLGDGEIHKTELVMATAAWYSHVVETKNASNSKACAIL